MSDTPQNPWRQFIENCISGDNYFRANEYRELLAYMDATEAELAAATARAESAERDALQRAADVCEVKGMEWQRQYIAAKENDHLLNGLSSGALSCRDEILALIPKERT